MKRLLIQISVCGIVFGLCLHSYLDHQNTLTKIKIQLPQLEKEIQLINEENCRLSYEVDRFENPTHLIEIVHRSEFSHLKHPILKEILTVPEAIVMNELSQ